MTFTSFSQSAATLLAADSQFKALITGAIIAYDDIATRETGRLGLNRTSVPEAFSKTTGLLKPSCVVKDRAEQPYGGFNSEEGQVTSYSQKIELWLYDDGDSGYDTIKQARERAYLVLENVQITGSFQAIYDGATNNMHAPELDDANLIVLTFTIIALRHN